MSSLEEEERETTRGIEARTPGFFESILWLCVADGIWTDAVDTLDLWMSLVILPSCILSLSLSL